MDGDANDSPRSSYGEQAVRLTREMPPDVVLMDVQMPVMDGGKTTTYTVAVAAPDATPPRRAGGNRGQGRRRRQRPHHPDAWLHKTSGGCTLTTGDDAPTSLAVNRFDRQPTNRGVTQVATFAFALLFLMGALMFGQQIAASVVEEKQSRII